MWRLIGGTEHTENPKRRDIRTRHSHNLGANNSAPKANNIFHTHRDLLSPSFQSELAMMDELKPLYEALPKSTSIRILILAPGEPDDDISCWLIPCDLNCDTRRSTDKESDAELITSERLDTFRGSTNDGQERLFPILFDYVHRQHANASDPYTRIHSFQSYEALSYVWGDSSSPQQIFLNGSKHVPVTRNLYNLLRSLRERTNGRRLWVDALCINQSDVDEKKSQIALMRRIYQQAQRVLAYIPFPLLPDSAQLVGLTDLILQAANKCRTTLNSRDTASQPMSSCFNISNDENAELGKEPGGFNKEYRTASTISKTQEFFIEDFGLPSVDSPLWDTWRNFMSSQYFSRVWILQEFVLAPNLEFFTGELYLDAKGIISAFSSIVQYSGQLNAYMFPPSLTNLQNATTKDGISLTYPPVGEMFFQRIHVSDGKPKRKLIDQLKEASRFKATDLRDKIYALLGLASDGDSYARHVSYAVGESYVNTFLRFARLLVERGDGFSLLLQVEFRKPDTEKGVFPSWVPRWLQDVREPIPLSLNESFPAQMQVLDDNWTLKVRGAFVDEIEHMSNVPFQSILTYDGRGGIKNFLLSFVPNLTLIWDNRQPRHDGNPDDYPVEIVFQEAFEALTQPPASGSTTSDVEESAIATKRPEESEQAVVSGHEENTRIPSTIRIWRAGFQTLLKSLFTLTQNETPLLEDQFWTNVDKDHPELRAFLDRVSSIAAGRRMCVTKHGMIGLVPDTSVKGDRIAYFDGCGNPFILHPADNLRCNDMDSPNKSRCTHSLVGATHFPTSLFALDSPDVVHDDIFLV